MQFFTTFSSGKVLVKSDSTPQNFKALYVGGVGDLTIIDATGTSVLFSAVPVGTFLPISGSKLMSTGTTATLVVGLT